MPFGEKCEYKDFAECVRRNSDKESPDGYCAAIQQATEKKCAERRASMRHSYRSISGFKTRLLDRVTALDPALGRELRNLKLPWYTIRNEGGDTETEEMDTPEETTAEVLIFDEIGGSFGISAEDFVMELQAIDTDNIDVRINSPGGSVFDAIAIYNALIKHPANVTTYVEALAASAASIIAMAGDKCVMMVGSQMMIHDALGAEMGNAREMREMAKFLDAQSDNLATIYAAKGGGEAGDWRDLMLAETWMLANEAVDMGLADEVYVRPPKTQDIPQKEDTEPDPNDPNKEEEKPEKEMPMMEDDESIDDLIDNLLREPHRLTNRGWKYSGRNKAPAPKFPTGRKRERELSHAEYVDSLLGR